MAVPPRENYTRWQPTCFRFHERDFAGTRGRACRLILSWARISTAPSPSHPFFLLRLDPSPFIFPANLLSRVEKLSPRAAHSLERRKKKWMDSGLRLNNRTCSSGEEVWSTLKDSRVISSILFPQSDTCSMIYYTRGERRGYFIAFFPLLKFNPSTCDHICTSIVGIESFREKEMRCREMGVSIFFDIGLRASKQANFSTALAQV